MKLVSCLVVVASTLLASCAQTPSAPAASTEQRTALISITGDGEFVETERSSEHSTVQVRRAPQGSVPAAMFTLRGVCAVLRARSQQFVTSTPVAGSSGTYRLTFPSQPSAASLSGASKSVFTLAECRSLGF